MPKQSTSFDYGDSQKPSEAFVLHQKIIEDRGSRYSVSYGLVRNREEIKNFLKKLKKSKKYAAADHNSWAARLTNEGVIYETKK